MTKYVVALPKRTKQIFREVSNSQFNYVQYGIENSVQLNIPNANLNSEYWKLLSEHHTEDETYFTDWDRTHLIILPKVEKLDSSIDMTYIVPDAYYRSYVEYVLEVAKYRKEREERISAFYSQEGYEYISENYDNIVSQMETLLNSSNITSIPNVDDELWEKGGRNLNSSTNVTTILNRLKAISTQYGITGLAYYRTFLSDSYIHDRARYKKFLSRNTYVISSSIASVFSLFQIPYIHEFEYSSDRHPWFETDITTSYRFKDFPTYLGTDGVITSALTKKLDAKVFRIIHNKYYSTIRPNYSDLKSNYFDVIKYRATPITTEMEYPEQRPSNESDAIRLEDKFKDELFGSHYYFDSDIFLEGVDTAHLTVNENAVTFLPWGKKDITYARLQSELRTANESQDIIPIKNKSLFESSAIFLPEDSRHTQLYEESFEAFKHLELLETGINSVVAFRGWEPSNTTYTTSASSSDSSSYYSSITHDVEANSTISPLVTSGVIWKGGDTTSTHEILKCVFSFKYDSSWTLRPTYTLPYVSGSKTLEFTRVCYMRRLCKSLGISHQNEDDSYFKLTSNRLSNWSESDYTNNELVSYTSDYYFKYEDDSGANDQEIDISAVLSEVDIANFMISGTPYTFSTPTDFTNAGVNFYCPIALFLPSWFSTNSYIGSNLSSSISTKEELNSSNTEKRIYLDFAVYAESPLYLDHNLFHQTNHVSS